MAVPPDTVNAPVSVSVEAVILFKVVVPELDMPVLFIVPPTWTFAPMPTPPVTTSAPDDVFTESVAFCIDVIPDTCIFPPVNKLPPSPTPPDILSAPEAVLVDTAVEVT